MTISIANQESGMTHATRRVIKIVPIARSGAGTHVLHFAIRPSRPRIAGFVETGQNAGVPR